MNQPATTTPSTRRAIVYVGLWILTVGVGLGYLLVYSNTPGEAREAPERWPDPEGVALDPEHATLLMFAHPRCPCTRASLHELDRLVAQVGGRVRGRVLFYRPSEVQEGWERTDLWRMAETIPGFVPAIDLDGEVAREFGAATSGHVVLYDRGGDLVFSGGVTAARAHEGDNRGRDAIRHFTNEGDVIEARTPVYGCDLLDGEACVDGPDDGVM